MALMIGLLGWKNEDDIEREKFHQQPTSELRLMATTSFES